MSFKDILTVTEVDRAFNDFVTDADPDRYRLKTFGTDPVRINVGLTKMTAGNDADVRLFLDNGDGKLDPTTDRLMGESRRGGNLDDSINTLAPQGTYFVEVKRFAGAASTPYRLSLNAPLDNPHAPFGGILAVNTNLDPLFTGSNGFSTASTIGSLTVHNTSDVHAFSVGANSLASVTLEKVSATGSSHELDARLIRDLNNNGFADQGEVSKSIALGTAATKGFMTQISAGNYFIETSTAFGSSINYKITVDKAPLIQ